ncbi:hypothetical protein, partial [Pseudomonas sp. C2B4]|uniref:hypothetical protein n=1 Tax=Pseudomonas sp. C2B4 TaxID=2735270 RepID=UPI001C49BE1D
TGAAGHLVSRVIVHDHRERARSYRQVKQVSVGFKRLWRRVFKRPRDHFLKATNPCAAAYRYARIRRLVRLGAAG